MKWRLKVLFFIFLVLAVQLVFLALCYSNLSSFAAMKYGAPSDNAAGRGVVNVNGGYRSAREIPGAVPNKKMAATSLKWLLNVTTTAVYTTTEASEMSVKITGDVLPQKEEPKEAHISNTPASTLSKEPVTTANNVPAEDAIVDNSSEERRRRLHPPTMLPHSESADNIKEAAELERRRTLERLRTQRVEDRKKVQEEYRRKAAERRAQREAKGKESKETPEEKRNRALKKTIPQMEKDRAGKMQKLWEKEKRKPGQANLDFDKFMAQYEGDPMSSSLSEYFKEVCESRVEPLVECSNRSKRKLNASEAEGADILFSLRTTLKYHEERLPLLFETWLSDVDPANVYIVTDGDDEDLTWKLRTLRMNFVNTQTGSSHNMSDLCCKAGFEMELMYAQENLKFNWLCHIDDDMYLNMKSLTEALAHFDPLKEKIYFGRSGSLWERAREVKEESGLGMPGKRFHFAVGGMYCLSRAMMAEVKEQLGGCEAFRKSCLLAQEPEDVTVGLVVGALLDLHLERTEMIYSHGLDLLSAVPTANIRDQVAFSYGLGSENFRSMIPNVVYVPGGLFNLDEDNTQFKSLHCYIHPDTDWCVEKRKQVLEEKKRRDTSNASDCVCSWKHFVCCQIYKDNHRRFMAEKKKEERKKRLEARKKKQ